MTDVRLDTEELLSQINIHNKYAKYLSEKQRRENWGEILERNKTMHIKKFPSLAEEINQVYKLVLEKKILPSMRSLQFAGKPIEVNPSRIYNCSYMPIDNYKAFGEIMFLLLGGCFEKSTKVKTAEGDKEICEITTNDLVLTYDEEQNDYYFVNPLIVTETISSEKPKLELTLENGSKIVCTEDHLFLTKTRGWVEAKNLLESDIIENYDNFSPTR